MNTTIEVEGSKLIKFVETEVLHLLKEPLKDAVHEAVAHAVEKVALHPTHPAAHKPAPADSAVKAPHKPGGVCAAVWGELDRLAAKGETPTLAQIQKVGKRRKWNVNNTRIEYYLWRKAQGIHGRIVQAASPEKGAVQHADQKSAA